MTKKFQRKLGKKYIKYCNIVFKEFGIKGSVDVTQNIMICNAGLGNGVQREDIVSLFGQYGLVEDATMLLNKSFSFVSLYDINSAEKSYENIHGKLKLPGMNTPVFLLFVEKAPDKNDISEFKCRPPGLVLIEDFISEEEESFLLNLVNFKQDESARSLKNRQVKHFGYEFVYGKNNVDKENPLSENLPKELNFINERLIEKGLSNFLVWKPNQLTVNSYLPGQGIPPHIDTHSAFEGLILSLSLGSDIIMDFKNDTGVHLCVPLSQRSLTIMTGESRYSWTHGIAARKSDVILKNGGGLVVKERGHRISFTLRRIRKGECKCCFTKFCDSKIDEELEIGDEMAARIENIYVHQVYEKISSHFSRTRHSPWPRVLEFVRSFPGGSILIDVGCGNGKYFGYNTQIFEIGGDHSFQLAQKCRSRNFEAVTCNCLNLPFRCEIADGLISIAVIHHLTTKLRRLKAIKEIMRVLKPQGLALIYVWAKNQNLFNVKSKYLKDEGQSNSIPKGNSKLDIFDDMSSEMSSFSTGDELLEDKCGESEQIEINSTKSKNLKNIEACEQIILPVHSNRTKFKQQNVLVPWNLKPQKNEPEKKNMFLRFYHVFEENELENLCLELSEVNVMNTYYDEGNWCIVLQKKS